MQLLDPLSKAALAQKQVGLRTVLDRRSTRAVLRVLLNSCADRLLVSGRHIDELWEIPSGKVVAVKPRASSSGAGISTARLSEPGDSPEEQVAQASASEDEHLVAPASTAMRSAFQHPSNSDWFVTVTADIARIYTWADFTELTAPEGLRLARQDTHQASISTNHGSLTTSNATYHVGPGFVVEHIRRSLSRPSSLYVWAADKLDPARSSTAICPAMEPNLTAIGPAVLDVLGMTSSSTIVFLDVDLWVCSTQLQSVGDASIASPNISRTTVATGTPSSLSFRSGGSSSMSGSRWPGKLSTMVPSSTHARRHFFVLSEWRDAGREGTLRCTLAPSPVRMGRADNSNEGSELVVAAGHSIVVFKGVFVFSESVNALASPHGIGDVTAAEAHVTKSRGGTGESLWTVVSGSMHRRSSTR
jgi:hypothetical protein